MAAIAFDTLRYVKTLKAAGVEEKQAEAMAEAQIDLMEQMEDTRLKELATKGDVRQLEIKIMQVEVRIAESKAETIKWMFGVAAGQAMFIIAILKLFPSHGSP
ncbi:MAG: CCDC90 family protein [Magnetococcus sp. THC-1_WYH]